MQYAVTGSQMKQIDQDTIQRIGIPSLVLMERAALATAREVEALMAEETVDKKPSDCRVLAACGMGNNGADGIAVARILKNRGYDTAVLLVGNPDHATEEHKTQQEIAARLGVPVVDQEELAAGQWDVLVDAIFGIGLTRQVEGAYRRVMEQLSAMAWRKVVAVDIPSGIHSDTGAVMGVALKADRTVTFGFLKTGLLLYPGRAYAGTVQVAEIGFSAQSLERVGWNHRVLEPQDLKSLPERQADGNKGTFGKLLIIAGSRGMSGAAYLSALASYRSGVGLVKVLTVEDNRMILQTQLPEAIVTGYDPGQADREPESFREFVESQCDWADAIVLGPGLGQEPYVKILTETVLSHAYVPMVLDADGLNTIAANPGLERYFTENIVVTPHMGEMARLTGASVARLKEDPLAYARQYSSRTGVVCVLKDAATVISDKDGEAYVNASGSSAMAKGGSGDVLTGIIGAFLAQGMEMMQAASYGVYLHGLAGEAASRKNRSSLLPHELADALAEVYPV